MSRLVVWTLDDDVIASGYDGLQKTYRTVIVRAGEGPPAASVALCLGSNQANEPALVAVARVGKAQRVATNRVRVRCEPFELLDEPVLLRHLAEIDDAKANAAVSEAGRASAGMTRLTVRTSGLLRTHLQSTQPEIAAIVERLLAVRWWDWPDEVIARHLPRLLNSDISSFLDAAENYVMSLGD